MSPTPSVVPARATLPARPRVGLVIGSGGIKCAAAIGLWRVLVREGIGVDVAVGCSGGSIYAAALALGQDVHSAETRTHHMWSGLFNRVRYRSLLRMALPRLFGFSERVGLMDDTRVWGVMEALYGNATFADTRIPLFIGATDLRSGDKVTITEGRIADAVRASISLPIILRPWPVGERLLIDGGASNPLPIDIAIREGCEIIIAMGFENAPHGAFRSISRVVTQTTSITIDHLLRSTYAFYSAVHHAEIVPVMPDFGRHLSVTDHHLIPFIIEQGECAAEAVLPYLHRLLTA
jgi:NTE family protein